MRSRLECEKQSTSTTTNINTLYLPLNKSSNLFNHIEKLAADHHVKASNTMIKVTYKKALGDDFTSSNFSDEHKFTKNSKVSQNSMSSLKKTDSFTKPDRTDTSVNKNYICDSDFLKISSNMKSSNTVKELDQPLFHSTPKHDIEAVERKKREYVNGLNLVMKSSDSDFASSTPIKYSNLKPVISLNSSTTKSENTVSCKLAEKKNSNCETMPSSTIKFPKGITVIKVKGSSVASKNTSQLTKDSSMIKLKSKTKRDFYENNFGSKDKTVPTDMKKKIKPDITIKKIKKSGDKLSLMKKLVKNSKESETNSSVSKSVLNAGTTNKKPGNNVVESPKKKILLEDPDLPSGWKRVVSTRNKGTPHEKNIVYIYR